MISKFDLAQSLLDKAVSVSSDNNYTLIPFGEKYEPSASETYVTEYVIYGDDNSLGYSVESSDIQFGIYQLTIYTPKTEKGYQWKGLAMVDVYSREFSQGLHLASKQGQQIEIIKASTSAPNLSKTHMAHVLSIRFNVIN